MSTFRTNVEPYPSPLSLLQGGELAAVLAVQSDADLSPSQLAQRKCARVEGTLIHIVGTRFAYRLDEVPRPMRIAQRTEPRAVAFTAKQSQRQRDTQQRAKRDLSLTLHGSTREAR